MTMTNCIPRWLGERPAVSRLGRGIGRRGVAVLLALACGMGARAALAASCVGDCNDDGVVTVDELVKGVNIALDSLALDQCPRFDCRETGRIAIDFSFRLSARCWTGAAQSRPPARHPHVRR